MHTKQIPCYFPVNSLSDCESPVFMLVWRRKFIYGKKFPVIAENREFGLYASGEAFGWAQSLRPICDLQQRVSRLLMQERGENRQLHLTLLRCWWSRDELWDRPCACRLCLGNMRRIQC